MNLNVLRHPDNLATGFDVVMQQCGIVKLQRSRCSKWLLMTRSDFYGCVINGPITDSNAIASNHSPFNQGCSVCGQPWAEHRATSQIKARWPGCVHASMAVCMAHHNWNSGLWVSHQSIIKVPHKYQWLVKNPPMMKSRNSNGMLRRHDWTLLFFLEISVAKHSHQNQLGGSGI